MPTADGLTIISRSFSLSLRRNSCQLALLSSFGKMSVDFLLHESSVGYAIFQVVHQADAVGNRLREVQASVQVIQVYVP